VELRGLEPLTPCMPCRCATSCATAPDFAALAVSRRSNLISLMHFCPVRQSAAMGVSPAAVPCLTAWDGTVAGKLEEPKNPPESSDSGGLSVELRGLEPLTPCMPCRCATSCATAPNYCCSASFFSRVSPKQLKYLRTAIPKIPNRAYSAGFSCCYSASEAAGAFAEVSSPSCRSTTGQSFQRRSSA
jgi:hypothetical protein